MSPVWMVLVLLPILGKLQWFVDKIVDVLYTYSAINFLSNIYFSVPGREYVGKCASAVTSICLFGAGRPEAWELN